MTQINVEVSYKVSNQKNVKQHNITIKEIASKFSGRILKTDWETNEVYDVELEFPTIEKTRKFLQEAYRKKLIEHDTLDDIN